MVAVFTAEFGGGSRLASVSMAGVGLSPAALMVQLLLLVLPQRLKDEGSSEVRAAVDGAVSSETGFPSGLLQDHVCLCARVRRVCGGFTNMGKNKVFIETSSWTTYREFVVALRRGGESLGGRMVLMQAAGKS